MTTTYEVALETIRKAPVPFTAITSDYRSGRINDAEFLAAKAIYNAAEKELDAVYIASQSDATEAISLMEHKMSLKTQYETAMTALNAAKGELIAFEATMPDVVEFGGSLSNRWNVLTNRYFHANTEMLKAKNAWDHEQSKASFERAATKSSTFRQFTVDEARDAFGAFGL